jgi:hypothetical protein
MSDVLRALVDREVDSLLDAISGRVALTRLGRNLAMAGALCEAFDAGFQLASRDFTSTWEPNVKGVAWRP